MTSVSSFFKTFFPKILLSLLLTTSSLIFVCCKSKEDHQKRPPIEVEVLVIDTLQSTYTRTYVGKVEALESLALRFVLGGEVEHVYVHPGEAVKAGQPLVSINKSTAQNAYNAAKAQLNQAQDAYQRLKKVYDRGALPDVKWVELLTKLEEAKSTEQLAHKQLIDCVLTAPCSGIIGECTAHVGQSLIPGESIVTILNIQQVSVNFSVPENEISAIQLGDSVSIVIPALNDQRIAGTIAERSIDANPLAHNYTIKVILANPEKRILPGMTGKIYLQETNKQAILVPAHCVHTRTDGPSVWVVHQGKAEQRTIQVSKFVANGVLITEGLHAGDSIITSGFQKLYNGAYLTLPHK